MIETPKHVKDYIGYGNNIMYWHIKHKEIKMTKEFKEKSEIYAQVEKDKYSKFLDSQGSKWDVKHLENYCIPIECLPFTLKEPEKEQEYEKITLYEYISYNHVLYAKVDKQVVNDLLGSPCFSTDPNLKNRNNFTYFRTDSSPRTIRVPKDK